jgi:hypothetical protein
VETEYDFLLLVEYFIKFIMATKDRLVLLPLEMHQLHLAVRVLDLEKEKGAVLLSLPPHTTYKVKPLCKVLPMLN